MWQGQTMADADIIVVGAGLAGLVAAAEAADAGRSVIVLDQEGAASLGGQAWWSLGGLFLVNTPEQRHLGREGFRRPRAGRLAGLRGLRPSRGSLAPAVGEGVRRIRGRREARRGSRQQGIALFPIPGWAERGGYEVGGHGNSVPRFHLVWGSGPGVLTPFVRRVTEHVRTGRIRLLYRHRVTALVRDGDDVTGVSGEILEADRRRARSTVLPGGGRRLHASAAPR